MTDKIEEIASFLARECVGMAAPDMHKLLLQRYPDVTEEEVDDGFLRAAAIAQADGEAMSKEADELRDLRNKADEKFRAEGRAVAARAAARRAALPSTESVIAELAEKQGADAVNKLNLSMGRATIRQITDAICEAADDVREKFPSLDRMWLIQEIAQVVCGGLKLESIQGQLDFTAELTEGDREWVNTGELTTA